MSPIGREMLPVLSSLGFGLSEVLGVVLGPGVGSLCWNLVDTGWDVVTGPGTFFWVGNTDAQTASVLALPGVATKLQIRWGLQVSVDEVVSEKVPGGQALHFTSDVAVACVVTPWPGRHLLSGTHCRHPTCRFSTQYQPGLQVQIRFCSRVQA